MSKPTAPPLDDAPMVPVRTTLRPSTYRAFAAHARELGVDVGALLSRLADRALVKTPERTPVPRRRRRSDAEYAAIDPEIRRLNELGWSDGRIARHLDLSQPVVSTRRRGMGIESAARRGQAG